MELIEICSYVKGGCTNCPLEWECDLGFQSIKTKEEWKKEFDEKITKLIEIRQRLDVERD